MYIVAEFNEETREIFRVSVWTELPDRVTNYLDITDREGVAGNVSDLIGKFVINGQITDAVTQVVAEEPESQEVLPELAPIVEETPEA